MDEGPSGALAVMRVPYVDLPAQHAPLEEELLEAVRRVLHHGAFILGPEVEELETALARRLGVPWVVGVASGTDALILALRLRGVGQGDEVLVPSHSFFVSAHAIRLVGAEPVFVDIEPGRMLMGPDRLGDALTNRTRAVMPVHLGGHPCDMDRIGAFCAHHGLDLIEDCAQAIGARWRNRSVGDFGVGCFSLHPLKTLSAPGDAGFISVQDEQEVEHLRLLRNLGLQDRDHTVLVSAHSRLDTLQAALLLVKLRHLDEYVEARRAHARAYTEALDGPYRTPSCPIEAEPAWSTFVVRHPERDRILTALRVQGFDVKVHYPIPIHLQKPYTDTGPWQLPETERTVGEIMTLPVSPELQASDRDALIAALLALA